VPNPDPRIVFGKRVRELRIERNLSQEKLAELAELHRNYVGGIERGERNVGLLNIVKLAHGLNVRPAKLIEPIRLTVTPTSQGRACTVLTVLKESVAKRSW
jgi:transcriptional regulator with XRE-family HTH domain